MCLDDTSLSLDLQPATNCEQLAGQQVKPSEDPVQWLQLPGY